MAAPGAGRSFIRFSIISISISHPSTLQDVKDAAASAPKPCVCTLSGCSLEFLFKKLPLVMVCCRLPYHHTRMKLSWFPPLQEQNQGEKRICSPPSRNSYFNINISATNGKSPHNQLPTYRFLYFLYELLTDFVHFSVHFRFIVFVAFVYGLLFLSLLLFFIMRRRCISSDVLALEEKKSICSFFWYCSCSVHIGRFIRLSLFNKVFDFISSIGTHGIHICVVWSCNFLFSFFLSVQINVIVSISFFRCLNKMCFLQIQGVQVCGIKRVIIQTTDFLQIKAYTVTEANVFSFALWGLICYMISFGHLSIHIQSLVPKW